MATFKSAKEMSIAFKKRAEKLSNLESPAKASRLMHKEVLVQAQHLIILET